MNWNRLKKKKRNLEFATHKTDKGLWFRIHEEVLQTSKKVQKKKKEKKMRKRYKHFIDEDVWMASDHI